MDIKTFKEKIVIWCKECRGTGVIKGEHSLVPANCLFCRGSGTTSHGPRAQSANLIAVMKWCEDYIDGKKDGWYH
jgi:DnaJ-class molecular chaperone